MGVRRRSGADKFDISSGDLRELCVNLLIFSRLFACFAGPFPGAKAGGFAYEWGKGWSLRLRMGQRLEPSLTHEAKAGAFAYA